MGTGINCYGSQGHVHEGIEMGNPFIVVVDPNHLLKPNVAKFDQSEIALSAWQSRWPLGTEFREEKTGQRWQVVEWPRGGRKATRQRLVEVDGSGEMYPKGNCCGMRREEFVIDDEEKEGDDDA